MSNQTEEKPKVLYAFRKDPSIILDDYHETVLHVGAITNKLDELKATLESKFGAPESFETERFDNEGETMDDGENIDYILNWSINNEDYIVSLQYIACPIPFSMAQIHHASVRVLEGKPDEITPVIEEQFRLYESEINQRIKKAEEYLESKAD